MIALETLSEGLLADHDPKKGVTYIEGDQREKQVAFHQLRKRALGILRYFQRKGLKPGDELIILTNISEQFIDVFWACILGKIVPVPLALGISDDHRIKIFRIFEKLNHPRFYIDQNNYNRLVAFAESKKLNSSVLQNNSIIIDEMEATEEEGQIQKAEPEDIALLQFSSGSTSLPKGVVLTHRNIVTNIKAIIQGIDLNQKDSGLSWMPLTHDMGLIGFHLTPTMRDVQHYIMPTELFIRRPLLWLSKATEKKATVLCSPNFGFKHFLKAYENDRETAFDLSSVKVLFNGAEPISAPLCETFNKRLEKHRLDPKAMFPVYGLAEASLAVSFPTLGEHFKTISINRNSLGIGDNIQLSGNGKSVEYMIEGKPVAGCHIRITDNDGKQQKEKTIGRVQIRGENVTQRYYNDPVANREYFTRDGWLDTGDLGFLMEGELVITGRDKEIIFVYGQNHYPHDVEQVLESVEGLETGKVAVTGIRENQAEEDTILVFVLHKGKVDSFVPLISKIKKAIATQLGIPAGYVIPIQKIPKTTSGKIQRYLLAEAFDNGEFDEVRSEIEKLEDQGSPNGEIQTKVQSQLMEICNALITNKNVSIHDNIFEIGTTSLTLAQIHERIEELYPGKLEITDFFDYPTIEKLAAHIENKQ